MDLTNEEKVRLTAAQTAAIGKAKCRWCDRWVPAGHGKKIRRQMGRVVQSVFQCVDCSAKRVGLR